LADVDLFGGLVSVLPVVGEAVDGACLHGEGHCSQLAERRYHPDINITINKMGSI
jgi:hypothetical protein